MHIMMKKVVTRFTIPYAPIAMSLPYLASCWLIIIAMIEEAAFIRKGPTPIAKHCPAILLSICSTGLVKCSSLLLSEKNLKV